MNAVEKWHDIMKNPGSNVSEKLDELLDDDVIFYSPAITLTCKTRGPSLCEKKIFGLREIFVLRKIFVSRTKYLG